MKKKFIFLKKGCCILKSNIFNMYFCDKKSLEDKNIIIISKKLGNAPYRNYIRRCTKEILRKYHKKNEKRLFFIFHKTEKNIKYSDIEKKLNSDFVF